METQTITEKKAAQDVGQPISKELAVYLTNGFKQKFPDEKPVVFVAKQTVMKAIEGLDNVSGIRFMYGYGAVNDAASRVLLLIPCNNTSTHLAIPNSIILPQGYIANTGERVGFEKTWQLLYSHTARFTEYFPELAYNEIMRGTFIGINNLLALIERADCAGINFNFGYDESLSIPSARNRPVFEAIDIAGFFIDPPMDFTAPCPKYCDFTFMNGNNGASSVIDADIQKLGLDIYFRDEYLLKQEGNGPLIEMYYYADPSILEKVTGDKNAMKIYESTYQPQITAFNNLLAEGNYEEAKAVFENAVYGMVETYLFQ